MVDFALTDEQIMLRDLARRFVAEEVRPRAAALDAETDPAACFSWEIVERASAAGLRTLTLEAAYGGAGADSLTTALLVEELAVGDLGVAVIFAQTWKILQTLQRACTPDQRERYLPRFRDDPRCLLAIGISEPEFSSDYIIPSEELDAGPSLVAEPQDGAWVLNGAKHFISNGNRAGLYLILARTGRTRGVREAMSAFPVARDAPGFSLGRVHDKMGERLVNNAELLFKDCRVPAADMVGRPGEGFSLLSRFFPASNAYAAASVVGVARAAYERSVQWARTRAQGGRRLIEHQTVATMLAEMRMVIDASRAYAWRAAWAADHPGHWDATLGALPKVQAAEAAWRAIRLALEIHGGHGYMRDSGVEKLARDAAAFLHSDGANASLKLKAANAIRQGA
jgi:alkylation response protein AidB-like acyl-CoA dehydrogenase